MEGERRMKRKWSQFEVSQKMKGKFYFNKDDGNFFIKRKGICSWTLNFGNPWVWLFHVVFLSILYLVLHFLP